VARANELEPFDPALLPAMPTVATFDDPRLPPLPDAREGYPWLLPRHRVVPFYQYDSDGGSIGKSRLTVSPAPRVADLAGIGLRWQSLIVSPTRLSWMTPPPVPPDPKFAWWQRLRQVDCAYVSSRGESDRFVYYDGPARGWPPVRGWVERGADGGGDEFVWEAVGPTPVGGRRDSILVNGGAGATMLSALELAGKTQHRLPLGAGGGGRAAGLSAADAEAWLTRTLVAHGLTPDEAAGLIDCWRTAFFEAPGRRLLTVASGVDYEAICPVAIRPPPTETARVAVFWTDVGP
jgi:hypothetical protein